MISDEPFELCASPVDHLKAEAERVAKADGTTLNQFINVAVAEKLSALRPVDYFRERAKRANLEEALTLLDSFGTDEPPREGDELDDPSAETWSIGVGV